MRGEPLTIDTINRPPFSGVIELGPCHRLVQQPACAEASIHRRIRPRQRGRSCPRALSPGRVARGILCLGLTTLVVACAAVKHAPVSCEEDPRATGIRYYRSAPYLLVHSDGKGGLRSEIIWLPDQTAKMSATPSSFLAKLESTLVFDKGVLTNSTDTADATALPKAILSALEKAVPAILAMRSAEDGKPKEKECLVPAPFLYRIVVEGDKITLVGGDGDVEIHAPLPPKVAH